MNSQESIDETVVEMTTTKEVLTERQGKYDKKISQLVRFGISPIIPSSLEIINKV